MQSNQRSNQTHSVVAVDLDTGLLLLLGGLGNVHRDCWLGQDDIGDNGVTHNVELLDQGITMVKQMATWRDKQHSKISRSTDQMATRQGIMIIDDPLDIQGNPGSCLSSPSAVSTVSPLPPFWADRTHSVNAQFERAHGTVVPSLLDMLAIVYVLLHVRLITQT
jgi:hypothetical protein